MKYYTYSYLREDGTPYYIGKGKGDRVFQKTRHNVKVPPKNRILFLKKNLTEEEAFNHEKYMIAVFGRKDLGTGILRNRTDGGDGNSGYKHSEEAKRKISQSNSGRKWSYEAKKRHSKMCLGLNRTPASMSQENREKLSKMRKGIKRPQYVIDKMMETRQENKSFFGCKNPNSKTFLFISPNGEEHVIHGGFKEFCLKNNLSYWGMQNFKKTGKMVASCKGWRVFCND